MKSIKTFDLFSKVSPDYTSSTALGGLISILTCIAMCGLFVLELQIYSSERLVKAVFVDQDQGAKLLQVNFNFTLQKMPCPLVVLDHLDILVDYQTGVRGSINKIRFDRNGGVVRYETEEYVTQHLEEIADSGESCVIEGNFLVGKVPGFFTFSMEDEGFIANKSRGLSFAHTVNHLSFGRVHKHSYISSVFGSGPHTNFAPYDGTAHPGDSGSHHYFIKVIPITYEDEALADTQHSYQYSMNYNFDESPQFSYLTFSYEVETVTVKYSLKAFQWSHFGVHICGVVGGVYVLMGLMLRCVYAVWKR